MYVIETLFSPSAPNRRDPASLPKAPSSNYPQELASFEIQISSVIIVSRELITQHKFLSDLKTRVHPAPIFTTNAKVQESSIQHKIPMWAVGANRNSGALLYNMMPTFCLCPPFLHPPHSLCSVQTITEQPSENIFPSQNDQHNHSQW